MGENQQNRFLFYEMTSVDIIVSNVQFTISICIYYYLVKSVR